jgi:hypothetical protein
MAVSRAAKVHYTSGLDDDPERKTACGRAVDQVSTVNGSVPVAFPNGRRLMSRQERRHHYDGKVTCGPCRKAAGFK